MPAPSPSPSPSRLRSASRTAWRAALVVANVHLDAAGDNTFRALQMQAVAESVDRVCSRTTHLGRLGGAWVGVCIGVDEGR